jgi:hypothetical protein
MFLRALRGYRSEGEEVHGLPQSSVSPRNGVLFASSEEYSSPDASPRNTVFSPKVDAEKYVHTNVVIDYINDGHVTFTLLEDIAYYIRLIDSYPMECPHFPVERDTVVSNVLDNFYTVWSYNEFLAQYILILNKLDSDEIYELRTELSDISPGGQYSRLGLENLRRFLDRIS